MTTPGVYVDGSNPPTLIRESGLAHGPAVHVWTGSSRPITYRRFRPAHSASISVFDVPSRTDRSVRRSLSSIPLVTLSCCSMPMKYGSPALTYWAWPLAPVETKAFGQVRSDVAT